MLQFPRMNSVRDAIVTQNRCYSNSHVWHGPSGPWVVTHGNEEKSLNFVFSRKKVAMNFSTSVWSNQARGKRERLLPSSLWTLWWGCANDRVFNGGWILPAPLRPAMPPTPRLPSNPQLGWVVLENHEISLLMKTKFLRLLQKFLVRYLIQKVIARKS